MIRHHQFDLQFVPYARSVREMGGRDASNKLFWRIR